MNKKQDYKKPSLNINEQINLLKDRGLLIKDEDSAKHSLNNISYYHLSGYFKPYQNKDDNFIEGTRFEDILDLYYFDRKLRLHFANALERIEKSFKTRFVYHLALDLGPNCFMENDYLKKNKEKIEKNLKESKEPFIKRFQEKYTNPYPPVWVLAEVLSFGDILHIYNKSLDTQMKKKVANYYGIGWKYLYSWLQNLREVRNICAHHSRLWNRSITKHLLKGNNPPELQHNSQIFDSIIITDHLLQKISPKFDWLGGIKKLIQAYKIDASKMGFPKNWLKIFPED